VAVSGPGLEPHRGRWFVIKIGGELAQDRAHLARSAGAAAAAFAAAGVKVAVVHGGGPQATDLQTRLGLQPIKVNCVVARGYNDADVVDMARRTLEKPWHVRFIEMMPLGQCDCFVRILDRFRELSIPTSDPCFFIDKPCEHPYVAKLSRQCLAPAFLVRVAGGFAIACPSKTEKQKRPRFRVLVALFPGIAQCLPALIQRTRQIVLDQPFHFISLVIGNSRGCILRYE